MDTREGEHCSELPDQEVMLDRELVNIWRKHLSFVVFWTTLHCLGGEMDPVLLDTATVIDTLGEEEKSLDDIRSGHSFLLFYSFLFNTSQRVFPKNCNQVNVCITLSFLNKY